MMTLQEIREAMQDRKLPVIAEKTGLHINTVRYILTPGANPTLRVLSALSDYFERQRNG